MSGCWYSLSFCLTKIIRHLCQMLPLLVLNLFRKCLEVQLSFVDVFLSFFSLLLLFVRVNCCKTRMRHFIVEKMNNRSNQDMLSFTKLVKPPLWNLTSVKKKEITCPFILFFKYFVPWCSLLQAVFCILFAELVESECFIKASLGERTKQFPLYVSSRIMKAS